MSPVIDYRDYLPWAVQAVTGVHFSMHPSCGSPMVDYWSPGTFFPSQVRRMAELSGAIPR